MVYDDIIIGSGLSAIATAYGLVSDRRKVLVLTGSGNNMRFYPKSTVPAAHRGLGGLGQYWHGVIPLSLRHRPWGMTEENWTRLARIFYPSADLETQIGQNLYFVPRRPIRPAMHIERLVADGRMETVNGDAQSVEIGSSGSISVKILGSEDILKAGRIWLCAGALDTPGLLMRSGLLECKDRTVSDHVIGYAGIVPANAESDALMHRIERRADGVIFPFSFDNDCSRFCTLRPARFDFAQLDGGISKRAVFGLPTNRIVSALFGNLSLGLISEAVFNKFGMFAAAEQYSAYFQTRVADAYRLDEEGNLSLNADVSIGGILASSQSTAPFSNICPTGEPALYIPGIHLHGSITADECNKFGPGKEFDALQIVDASALHDIGPEHHSFAMMAGAFGRALAA